MRSLALATLLFVAGCMGKPGKVVPPDVDAPTAAKEAVEQIDRNGDFALSAEELAACPALVYALPRYDTDGDRVLTAAEIEAGIARWSEAAIGARSLAFRVQLDGRALEGAQVKLSPVEFLNDAIKPATGESGRGGNGFLGMAAEDLPKNAPDLPLVQPGLYRVEITHPSQQISAKYNSNSTLGLEVARDSIPPDGIVWNVAKGK